MTSVTPPINSVDRLPAVLSIRDVGAELGISKMTVYRLLQTGQLQRLKIGSRSLIRRVELDRFLDAADTTYPTAGGRNV